MIDSQTLHDLIERKLKHIKLTNPLHFAEIVAENPEQNWSEDDIKVAKDAVFTATPLEIMLYRRLNK